MVSTWSMNFSPVNCQSPPPADLSRVSKHMAGKKEGKSIVFFPVLQGTLGASVS